jgi:hypothetical protein
LSFPTNVRVELRVTAENITDLIDETEASLTALISSVTSIKSEDFSSAQAAADAAAGEVLFFAKGDSVVLAVPSAYATVQLALDACARWVIPQGATVTIQVTGHVSTTGTIGIINHPYADRIKIRGTTAIETTFTQINSVTGSVGAYSVTATLADASNVEIDDIVMIRDVKPGVKAPGEYENYPTRGELRLAFFKLSTANRAYIKTVGTTATVWTDAACTTTPANLVNNYIQDGDIVVIAGQVRRATSVTPSGFTLSSALQSDVLGLQYWYHMSRSAQGTVSISSGVVTGNTTLFTTEYNVGDYIFIQDTGVAKITAITSDSGSGCITLDRTLPNCTTKSFGCMVLGELHEGAWKVTNKVGSQVTWTNTARVAAAKPPVLAGAATNISGSVYILKSSLRTTGTGKGLVVQGQGTADIDHLAIVGGSSSSSASVGVDLRGTDQSNPTHPAALPFLSGNAKLGTRAAVLDFGYGIWLQNNSFAALDYAMVTGCGARGVNANFGGCVSFKGSVIAGNTGIGVLIGPGAFAEWSDARLFGNSDDGVRGIGGGSTWYAEFPNLACNGSDGIAVDDAVSCHHNGCRLIGHAGDGVSSDNGGYGRMTGCIIIGNSVGVSWTSAQVEMAQNTILACGTGIITNNSRIDIDDAGIANCTSHAVRGTGATRILGRDVQITSCYSAIQAEEQSEIIMPRVSLGGLGVTATGGYSRVWIEGYVNGGSFSPATLNRQDTSWNVVSAGNDVDTVPLYPSLELGATDTTLTRLSAGDMAVEGNRVFRVGGTDVPIADGGTGASTAADARTNLGLGTIATQAANNVAITGGSISGITDLAIADGGTGASSNTEAARNLQAWYILARSAVPVTTSGTGAQDLVTVSVPANLLGANGAVRITTLWSFSGSAGTKSVGISFGGTEFANVSVSTAIRGFQSVHHIYNRNSTSSQVGYYAYETSVFATTTGTPPVTASVDTTSSVDIKFSATAATAPDTTTLEAYLIEVCPSA